MLLHCAAALYFNIVTHSVGFFLEETRIQTEIREKVRHTQTHRSCFMLLCTRQVRLLSVAAACCCVSFFFLQPY